MNNYIMNYILHQQLEYPSIFGNPDKMLTHLLFTNGNGVDLMNGNFIQVFGSGMFVPYNVLYKHLNSREAIIAYKDDREADREIERLYNQGESFGRLMAESEEEPFNEDSFWQSCVDEFNNRYDAVVFVDDYRFSDLLHKNFYVDFIRGSEYAPYLSLSKGYYAADKLNESTDVNLLYVTLAIAEAYLDVLKEALQGTCPSGWKNPIAGCEDDGLDSITSVYESDVKELTRLRSTIKTLLGEGT